MTPCGPEAFGRRARRGQLLADEGARILGAEHPGTLIRRNNLAVTYQDAGRVDEAIAIFERVLADRERAPRRRAPQNASPPAATSPAPTGPRDA
ncbi:MAG: tetratricopeptide repeat protein [Solirubrobacteraceae bacterium]